MTGMTDGRSLELYFIEGKPDGMLTAEVFNWTGHVLMTPRNSIFEALKRKEAEFTGVYILLGEKDGKPSAYIGESETLKIRILDHIKNKDWWTKAVLITSTSNNLHKAHVKYLEARLHETALAAKQMELDNGSTPTKSSLSEAARSNMETFLANVLMILPALRVDLFINPARSAPIVKPLEKSSVPRFILINPKRQLTANATLSAGEFIVEKGSSANTLWEGQNTSASEYAMLHEKLKKQGVLSQVGDHLVFNTDYAFSSLNAAAGVINGRPSNGTLEWKLEDSDITYKAWEASKLDEQMSEPK